MSQTKTIILRVQSPDGTKRIEINGNESTTKLYEKINEAFALDAFNLYRNKNRKDEIQKTHAKTVLGVGLRHGDMIYMQPPNDAASTVGLGATAPSTRRIIEDPIDQELAKVDGKIERQRDPKLCRHNHNSRCVHCSPIEPYDDAYLHEHNIKHLSFHAYLRKQTSGVDKGKFLTFDDISCRIKEGCKDHPPWPKGICSKCQPNAITLNRQIYRHVDNVTFENTNLVERFLNFWRATGHQRIGYLYGRYETHTDVVPLGIRATIVAIYEPPQEGGRDFVRLLPDEREQLVEQISAQLGLQRVGWIFTDLIPDDVQKGTVKHLRNIDTHFLSAEECIMAGHYQNLYPNPCRYASNGTFGSKFVTVCVTGDKSNQVHMEGYQVSNQCMALVRDNCLLPTKDAPELGYVRESSDKQYVPDVYYKEKDNYGNEVSRLARPLPVEYLLVDVPASTPVLPSFTFNLDQTKNPFPIENRPLDGELQDFNALNGYLSQFNEFRMAIRDFHLLIYIATMEVLPMRDYMGPLLKAIADNDELAMDEWARDEHWATVEQVMAASAPSPSRSDGTASGGAGGNGGGGAGGTDADKWTCPFCTFLNNSVMNNCEMCNLPRSSRPH